jgi:twitching motility protein PilT
MDLNALLHRVVAAGASDVHLKIGQPPILRLDGDLEPLSEAAPLGEAELEAALHAVTVRSPKRREAFYETGDLDIAYSHPELPRFRVNGFRQRGAISMAFRVIPSEIPSFERLGLPPGVKRLAHEHRGLILVTGPTGSGKSTTLAAIIDKINKERKGHIITVEDPIEFIHRHQSCIVNQREIGTDTKSFQSALKYALREDPDVILVGEMRDLETIAAALTIAETGHLALATLHTNSAAESINRIIDVFPSNQQSQVRAQLAFVLEGVITQTLLPKARGRGRAMACEIMVATPAIRALIRDDKIHQIYSAMQSGKKHGMQTMNDALYQLYTSREVAQEECERVSSEPKEFLRMIGVTPMEEQEMTTANGTQRAAAGRR